MGGGGDPGPLPQPPDLEAPVYNLTEQWILGLLFYIFSKNFLA